LNDPWPCALAENKSACHPLPLLSAHVEVRLLSSAFHLRIITSAMESFKFDLTCQ
jgi:hypothetical protein